MAFSVLAMAQARQGPVGQCKLVYTSATQVTLKPWNGNGSIKINGNIYTLPAAGLVGSNSGLAPSTTYYLYAFQTGGVVGLEWSTTGHVTSTTPGNIGVEIKSGDETRSLVGMVATSGGTPGGQFQDAANVRGVRSWFNDTGIAGHAESGTNVSTTSTTGVELDATARLFVLLWAGEQYTQTVASACANSVAGSYTYLAGGVNGSITGIWVFAMAPPSGGGYYFGLANSFSQAVGADGLYTLSIYGLSGSNTSYFYYKTNSVVSVRK
ncbi:hypothetical protein I6F34_01055 [Bradyrhizobium sp. BRP05]|nr:hypothetical protein [Bradyrhizobium sp. BRP05]